MAARGLTEKERALLREPHLGHLATLLADSSPQVTAVWVDVGDDLVLVNSTEGSLKVRNVRRDPRVALSVVDRSDPYRRLYLRGRVVGITAKGALEHKDALARKYLGVERFPGRRGGRRILAIRPDRVVSNRA